MKRYSLALSVIASGALVFSAENKPPSRQTEKPRVTFNNSNLKTGETYVYEQRSVGVRPVLIPAETATNLISRFKANYAKLESPRLVFYVNRGLGFEAAALNLTNANDLVQTTGPGVDGNSSSQTNSIPAPATNNVSIADASQNPAAPTATINTGTPSQDEAYKNAAILAEKQMARDIERLFGRPFRMAGAALADQEVARDLLSGRSAKTLSTTGEQAAKDREALSKIADVVVEVLISSRQATVSELSGDKNFIIPDIQATAIRLSDARIVGQTTAADVIGSNGWAARHFDAREIAEATALALMEDMLRDIAE